MPDTTIQLIDTNSVAYDTLSPELKAKIADILANNEISNSDRISVDTVILLALAIFGILFYLRFKDRKNETKPTSINNTHYLVYDGKKLGLSDNEIVQILTKYFPYYKNLASHLQEIFIDRLQAFMAKKIFVIYAKEGYKEMPVLLSAAAIQITFGLKKFTLPHYKYICIHPQEYFADNSFRVLAGHVKGKSITVAWNRFLNGFNNEHDGSNVGLHEMAHALYYQHIEADLIKPRRFTSHFDDVMELGEDVYDLKRENLQLYTSYAFTNLQEFWAESIEIFFERPEEFKRHYPDLFETMHQLLNQNPINKISPIADISNR